MKTALRAALAIYFAAPVLAQQPGTDAAPAQHGLTGTIVTFDGRPVAGAAIACSSQFDLDTSALLSAPQVSSDAAGRFALPATKPAPDALDVLYLHIAKKGMASLMRPIDWQQNEVGNIVLMTGQRLFGRVRDADGKPLAGVVVIARDLLEQGATFRSGAQSDFHCAAISKDSGIFQLPCTLGNGVSVEFHKPGYARTWLQPVAAGTPLEVTLQSTGWIQGRVLDEDGRGMDQAKIQVDYELRSASRPVLTAADGSFRVPVDRLGRWRVTAQKLVDGQLAKGDSNVRSGPGEHLEIIMNTPEAATKNTFVVRVVTKSDGTPVRGFKAVAVWEQYATRNTGYREYRFRLALGKAKPAETDTMQLPGPAQGGQQTGAIRVAAAGYAPATIKAIDWAELEDNDSEPLLVELEPESSLRGIVRDEGSGQPIAGARVRARLQGKKNEGRYPDNDKSDAIPTAADGTFEIRGLSKGTWELHIEADGHPDTDPTEVEVGVALKHEGVAIELPSGARVAGQLRGIDLDAGARVFLAPVPKQIFGDAPNRFFTSTLKQQQQKENDIPVQADGRFEFDGVALGNHQLVVRLPSRPRRGGDLFLPIEPFRVRANGIDREFDCSEDQPGAIRGKITFSHATTSLEHLIVVAQLIVDNRQAVYYSPYNQRHHGPRSFVERDGTFEIPVGPGDYRLTVVDLTTMVQLLRRDEEITVRSGKTVDLELPLSLTEVELSLAPAAGVEQMAAVGRVEVRFVPKSEQNARNFGGNEQYDSRTGLNWPPGTKRQTIALPAGAVTFLARNELPRIRTDKQRNSNQPLARGELEISPDDSQKATCKLEVTGPPEIPESDAPDQAGDADEAGQDAIQVKRK